MLILKPVIKFIAKTLMPDPNRVLGINNYSIVFIVLAVSLRVLLSFWYIDLENPRFWEFGVIARNLTETKVFSYHYPGVPSAYMPPAYPLMIGFLYSVFGISTTAHMAMVIILLICEAAIPFVIALIAEKLWNRQVGLLTLYISLFWPQLLIMSGMVNSLSVYNLILLTACATFVLPGLSFYIKTVLVGLLLGIYGNFRFEGILFLIPFLYSYFRAPALSEIKRTTKLFGSVVTVSLFVIALAPWLIRNYMVYDNVILSTSGGFNLLRGHNELASGTGRDPWPAAKTNPYAITPVPEYPDSANLVEGDVKNELIIDTWRKDHAVSFIMSKPGKEFKLLMNKFYYFTVIDFTHPIVRFPLIWIPSLIALVCGVFYFLRNHIKDVTMQFFWIIFSIQGVLSCMFFVLPRYRMNVEFIPLLFFSAAAVKFINKYIFQNRNSFVD